jgi:mono/diheme cytochrome c family protein
MKKYIILLMLSILLIAGESNAATIDIGKQIFDENCGSCHGGRPPTGASDAQSIMALAEDAKIRESSIGEIVRNGTKDGMPSFSKSDISDLDIEYLVDYLKSVPNSFDSIEIQPNSTISVATPEKTPLGTTQNAQVPNTTTKAPGIEPIFVILIILVTYIIRKN